MQIQVNTDNHTEGSAELTQQVQTVLEDKLRRFADRITRVEVQLTDQNSRGKAGGNDQRCVLEVRLSGMQPISVTDEGVAHDVVLRGAADKMQRLIETTLGKQGRR